MSQTSFIYGFHAVIAKLRHQPEAIIEIFMDSGRQDARARDLLRHAEVQDVRVMQVDGKRLEGMAGGGHRQGNRRHFAPRDGDCEEQHRPQRPGL